MYEGMENLKMIKELGETIKMLDTIKASIDAVARLLESDTFNKEDAVKVLKRISDNI
jgi:hypothetical protein